MNTPTAVFLGSVGILLYLAAAVTLVAAVLGLVGGPWVWTSALLVLLVTAVLAWERLTSGRHKRRLKGHLDELAEVVRRVGDRAAEGHDLERVDQLTRELEIALSQWGPHDPELTRVRLLDAGLAAGPFQEHCLRVLIAAELEDPEVLDIIEALPAIGSPDALKAASAWIWANAPSRRLLDSLYHLVTIAPDEHRRAALSELLPALRAPNPGEAALLEPYRSEIAALAEADAGVATRARAWLAYLSGGEDSGEPVPGQQAGSEPEQTG